MVALWVRAAWFAVGLARFRPCASSYRLTFLAGFFGLIRQVGCRSRIPGTFRASDRRAQIFRGLAAGKIAREIVREIRGEISRVFLPPSGGACTISSGAHNGSMATMHQRRRDLARSRSRVSQVGRSLCERPTPGRGGLSRARELDGLGSWVAPCLVRFRCTSKERGDEAVTHRGRSGEATAGVAGDDLPLGSTRQDPMLSAEWASAFRPRAAGKLATRRRWCDRSQGRG